VNPFVADYPEQAHHGDPPRTKREDIFRGICVNVNRFPVTQDDTKYHEFFASVQQYNPSVLMIQEPGINWNAVPHDQYLSNVATEHLAPEQARAYTSHNLHSGTNDRCQWGGTAIVSHGDICQNAMGGG
jgi:hypothetical protein